MAPMAHAPMPPCRFSPDWDFFLHSWRTDCAAMPRPADDRLCLDASIAARIHRRQFASRQINHPVVQSAVARDPAADLFRINFVDQLGAGAVHRLAPRLIGRPGRVETETRARSDTDLTA